jgi:hypothetical protein
LKGGAAPFRDQDVTEGGDHQMAKKKAAKKKKK